MTSASLTTRARLRLLVVPALAAAALALALAAPAGASAERATSSAACAAAGAHPRAVSTAVIRNATLCLLNAERRKRGLRPLRHNRRLATAASRHARDMVRHKYFSHRSRSGATFVDRILRTRYVRSRRGHWVLGENLAWGSGRYATPASIVRSWMRSPGHRRNILDRRFREIGIALVRRAPRRGHSRAATYVTEFGRR